jgi:protoporphyrinogen oxidase
MNMSSNGSESYKEVLVLGAGMTGLATGFASQWPVFEAEATAGGICSSYYIRPNSTCRLAVAPEDGEAYRFEIGGGHWIFGGDPVLTRFLRSLVSIKCYPRVSSVFFPEQNLYVPYPLQNHLSHLPQEIRVQALTEMFTAPKGNQKTMADSLRQSFGAILTGLFFGPFHELYTAGLWTRIAPQDGYKTPVDAALAIRGASEHTPPVGYNATFLYPVQGLNTLSLRLADQCDIHYNKRVVRIDAQDKSVAFEDGSSISYGSLVSTLPLNKMMNLAGLKSDEDSDPYTSVLVLNLGARRGRKCPLDHWIYLPNSRAGFHRVGFYDNVDRSFLPRSSRESNDRVSIYVERAYPGSQRPSDQEVKTYVDAVVRELQEWEFIGDTEVADPTWIDVAYTWSWPGSQWRALSIKQLEANDIVMVGRYAKWSFQGIADSIRDGLYVGAASRESARESTGRLLVARA